MFKKLKVLAYSYTIEKEENLMARRNSFAEFDPGLSVLRVDASLLKDENNLQNHVMHEVMESIIWQLGYSKSEFDHQKIEAIGNAICTVLIDNPKLTEMFLS